MTKYKVWECLSCNGIYQEQLGGYYHACPPEISPPRDENWEPWGKIRRMKHIGKGRKRRKDLE